MTGPQLLASFWTLWSVTLIGFVHSDIQFLERHEGESVVLPCVVEQTNPAPFAVALERSWLQNTKVMFMHTQEDFSTDSDDDQRRFSVSGDPSVREVNVTLSELKVTDTDRYYCTFYIYNPTSTDLRIRGTTEFFLLVTADDTCSCSTYSTLLYALSSATVLLLLLLLFIGSVVICKGRKGIRQEVRSLSPGPIYEEMVAMKPQSPKPAFKQLEEAESSEYRNCSVNKSCPQNHYEIPTGLRGPRM